MKQCSREGCTNKAVKGGDGAKQRRRKKGEGNSVRKNNVVMRKNNVNVRKLNVVKRKNVVNVLNARMLNVVKKKNVVYVRKLNFV